MIGDVYRKDWGHAPCVMEPDPFDFMEADLGSQIVITESAATCALEHWSETKIGFEYFYVV